MNVVSGIYQIQHHNGKRYIGSAINLRRRWLVHLNRLRRRAHHNLHLQRAFDKDGKVAFDFTILEYVADTSQLIKREQHFLNTLNPEYNMSPTAGSILGFRHTPEARQKISEANSGERHPMHSKRHSSETRAKMSKARRGKPYSGKSHPQSMETRRKISEALKGRVRSKEHCRNISKGKRLNRSASRESNNDRS